MPILLLVVFFQLAVDSTIRHVHSPFGLLVTLTFGSGFLSALFLNDTIALILTPLVVGVTKLLKLNSVPYLLALAGATNLGSVATLSGNPQNILIGSFSGISYLDFAKALTPIAFFESGDSGRLAVVFISASAIAASLLASRTTPLPRFQALAN